MTSRPRRALHSVAKSAADVDDFVTSLLVASRVLVGVSARSLAEVEDTVTLTQFRTLVVLDSSGEISLLRLAEIIGVNPSTAMRTIDRLLAGNLVTRRENPVNRRQVLLGLTDEGRRLVHSVTTKRRREIKRIVSTMPAGQRADLVEALRAFSRAAEEPDPSASASVADEW